MKADFTRHIFTFQLLLLVLLVYSCSNRTGNAVKPNSGTSQTSGAMNQPELIKMSLPEENEEHKLNDAVKVKLIHAGTGGAVDSIRIFFNGRAAGVLTSDPWEFSIESSFTSTTGRKSVKAVAYGGGKSQSVTRFVIIYSDIVPKKYGYRVINTFPHDPEAFTQGLFFDKGVLYEGTGQETGSSLRVVELETGRVMRQHNLDPSLFGEGITLYGERIFQVTWQNKVGFVYNKSDFSLINRIFYQNEGWGLTTVNDRIVRSDGTNMLYFHEPEMFNAVSTIEVYDNQKKVDQLNELEYISGEIWANIWQTDLIARIDPVSGRVNSYVDLSGLYPEPERRKANADVLNGIAWDAAGGRIFVTGKRWSGLYEIRITE